jgi:arsenate reductase (thioredoxin)
MFLGLTIAAVPLDRFSALGLPQRATEKAMTTPPPKIMNVLFLCTGNSARSIMAETILNALGKNQFKAYSAGSHPTGRVNPLAIELLQANRLPVEGLRSKSWYEFAKPDAPFLHFVFTVCDQAAAEMCPVWPGQPMTAHWGVPDPAAVEGNDEVKRKAFFAVYSALNRRISIFLSLPLAKIDRLALQDKLNEIGRTR